MKKRTTRPTPIIIEIICGIVNSKEGVPIMCLIRWTLKIVEAGAQT